MAVRLKTQLTYLLTYLVSTKILPLLYCLCDCVKVYIGNWYKMEIISYFIGLLEKTVDGVKFTIDGILKKNSAKEII